MGAIVSQAEVESFLSSAIVRQTYDDDNNGVTDATSIALIIDVSEGLFLAHVRGVMTLPLPTPIDPFAKYVVLQIIHCQSIRRFPEIFRKGLSVCEDVAELLKQIRKGELKLEPPVVVPADSGEAPAAYSIQSRYLREGDFTPMFNTADSSFENADDD